MVLSKAPSEQGAGEPLIWGAAAVTYMLDGKQYVLIPSGAALIALAPGMN